MDVAELLIDRRLTSKQRAGAWAALLLDGRLAMDDLVQALATDKAPPMATALEAIELATRTDASLATEAMFKFAVDALGNKAPAVKREAGRVIGNTARQFPQALPPAIKGLLANARHESTVVRWSAAFGLGAILGSSTPLNTSLLPKMKALAEQEEKESIRKMYGAAIKTATKRVIDQK